MGRQRVFLAVQTIQEPPSEEKKQEKEKVKVVSKEPEEHSLVKNKHRTRNGGQKKIVLGGPKENEARKAFRMVMKAFRKVVFAHTHQKRVQAMISTRTKAKARTKKARARKVLIFNLDFQPRKHPVKKYIAIPGNQTSGIPV